MGRGLREMAAQEARTAGPVLMASFDVGKLLQEVWSAARESGLGSPEAAQVCEVVALRWNETGAVTPLRAKQLRAVAQVEVERRKRLTQWQEATRTR